MVSALPVLLGAHGFLTNVSDPEGGLEVGPQGRAERVGVLLGIPPRDCTQMAGP